MNTVKNFINMVTFEWPCKCAFVLGSLLSLLPINAEAATDLGARATAWKGYGDSLKGAMLTIGIVVGIVLVIMGGTKLVKQGQHGPDGGGVGSAVLYLIAGGICAGVSVWLSFMNMSVIGADVSVGQP